MTTPHAPTSRIARVLGGALIVGSLATAANANGPAQARRHVADIERITQEVAGGAHA